MANALIYRQFKTYFRPRKLVAFIGLIAIILVIALGNLYASHIYGDRYHAFPPQSGEELKLGWQEVYGGMAKVCLYLQVIVCIYGALAISAECIGGERSRGTHDMLVTLPLSPWRKLWGLLIGHNLYCYLGFALLFPLGMLFSLLAGYSVMHMLVLYGLLLAGMVCFCLMGLAISSSLNGLLALLVAAGVFLAGMGIAGAIHNDRHQGDWSLDCPLLTFAPFEVLGRGLDEAGGKLNIYEDTPPTITLFNQTMPWQVGVLIWYAYLGVLSALVGAAKLSRPSLPPLRRPVTLLFFVLAIVLLLSFWWQDLLGPNPAESPSSFVAFTYAWTIGFFLLTFVWSLLTAPTYPMLLTWARRQPATPAAKEGAARCSHSLRRLVGDTFHRLAPNLVFTALLWIIACASLYYFGHRHGVGLEGRIALFLFACLLGLLMQANLLFMLGEAFWKRMGKFGGLVITFALCAGPLLIGLGQTKDAPSPYSPLSAMWYLGDLTPSRSHFGLAPLADDVSGMWTMLAASWAPVIAFLVIFCLWCDYQARREVSARGGQ